jgi:hypothetical protein
MSNDCKQRWNAAHYTQLKVSVEPELAASFKTFCSASAVSMASELSAFMRKRIGDKVVNANLPTIDTRKQRRKELSMLLIRLNRILETEQSCFENTPDNLVGSAPHETTEGIVSALSEGIESLEAAYE